MNNTTTVTLSWKQLLLPLMVFCFIYVAAAQLLSQSYTPVAILELVSNFQFTKVAGLTDVVAMQKSLDNTIHYNRHSEKKSEANPDKLFVEKNLKFITSGASSSFSAISTGQGGPILVISSTSNPFSQYPAEILLAEGLNEFATADVAAITAEKLSSYDVVIVGDIPLSDPQVAMLSDWSNAGGTLIALKPDAKLGPLLGLVPAGGTLANKYLLVNTATGPGKGIVNQTIQYQGEADYYTLNGATSLATLYSGANTATTYPAVTMRTVGDMGGKAVAFTYDLARSVVYTRQGNPEWAGQKRDGQAGPIRSDDQYYPNWVDLSKVMIPQADEQQRLLANIITLSSRKPLPRFWYLPRGLKAAVVMTGDDHGNGGTKARFNQYMQLSKDNSAQAVADWRAIRGTSYIYPNTPITDAEAKAFEQQGFEVALHLTTNCANFTPASLENDLITQLAEFKTRYPSIAPPSTNRTHCIAWSDWNTQPKLEAPKGIRLDANYYYWPSPWVQDRPGMFTGSGIPMRFTDLDGALIDCYQLTTQMTDESDQSFPYTIDQLLNKALGAEGYYGVFCANMHTDADYSNGSDAIIASAMSRNVPVISSKQLLTWLDGRNGSSFNAMSWNGNQLSFDINVANGANSLEVMLPVTETTGRLVNLIFNGGTSVSHRTEIIKGIEYVFFRGATGSYVATYDITASPNQAPAVAITSPTNGASFDAPAAITITATASDDVKVDKVEFYNGATKLGEDLTSPFAYMWSGVTAGTYELTTKATDNEGAVTTSAAVKVTVSAVCPCTVFQPAEAPVNDLYSDSQPLQLGMKFRSAEDGFATGVRFYKQAGNTGTHIGQLFSGTGALLAEATFVNETASGWQEVAFSNPVAITAGTTYVISYHSGSGFYSATNSYFSQEKNAPPLRGLANGENGANGVYKYSSSPAFPNVASQSTNYWVDVVFGTESPSSNSAPEVAISSPATGATFTAPASIAISATATDADGVVAKVEFYNGQTKLGEATSSPYSMAWNGVEAGVYSITAKATDNEGAVTTSAAVKVTVSAVCPCTVFQPAEAPVNDLYSDSQPLQLGMKFRSENNGFATGVRFYKQAGNTGTHIGQLYSSTGALLAEATFVNETASGWQEVAFSNPVAITAGTTYVISYYSGSGFYSATNSYFYEPLNRPPLSALVHGEAGANGVYRYGQGYPTESSLAANYWVDVVFDTDTPPANQPPEVRNPIVDQSATVGTAYTFIFASTTFYDPDNDQLSYIASLTDGTSLPAWLNFDGPNRTFSGTPPSSSPASLNIKLTASDGRGGTASDEFALAIGQPTNQPPLLGAIGNKTVNELIPLSFTAAATDDGLPDNNLRYSLTTGVPEASIDPRTGVFSWTPTEIQGPGNYTFTIKVSDGALTDEEQIQVQVSEVNQAPVLATVGNKVIGVGGTLRFTLMGMDADVPLQTLNYSANRLPSGASLDAMSGEFFWTPTTKQLGNHKINFRVSDGAAQMSETITVTVNNDAPVPPAPAISMFSPTSGSAGAEVFITGSNFVNVNTVAFNNTQALFTINSSSSITATVPSGATTGKISVTTQSGTATSSDNFTITTNSGSAPVVAITSPADGANFNAPASIAIAASASDADGTIAKVEFFNGAAKLGEDVLSPYEYTWNNVGLGDYALTARATDNAGFVTTSAVVSISVVSSNPAVPVISGFSPATGAVGDAVIVSGSNFTGASAVAVNGTNVSNFTVNSPSSLTLTVPAGATTGKISITTPGGTTLSSSDFTVTNGSTAAPVIAAFSPTRGALGDPVLISGTNLAGATSVKFGPSSASYSVDGDGNIIALVPQVNGKLPTSVKITVTTAGGSSTSSSKFTISSSNLASSSVSTLEAEPQGEQGLVIFPNPFYNKATVSFALTEDGDYTISLFDAKGACVAVLEQGYSRAGERRSVEVDGTKLAKGLYLLRMQTATGDSAVRVVLDR
ncbi:hypothetical protein GCM10023188_36070 [Pontibacter saemangeumensis]|uniref:Cadherin domain-containing protein n=1 Tax=Pontibacter saemangeumensis TaxID=1084525 RepID=A0ABP8LZE5_9BACT